MEKTGKWAILCRMGLIICLLSVPGWGQYGGGSGTEGDPFLISDPNHMQAIGEHEEHWAAGTWFQLEEDIDLSRFTGTQFNIIGYYNSPSDNEPFSGIFDGNGHRIYNFTYSTTSEKNLVGLFGSLGSDGQIKGLGLENTNITSAGDVVGGLVGINKGTISNCYANGAVNGGDDSSHLGGLVGRNYEGAISNCYATGTVNGGDDSGDIGGLVGHNWYGTISNCYANGAVNGDDQLGGLVGLNEEGTISNCHATGAVTGGDDSYRLGGLVGWNDEGTISNCYANGAVGDGYFSIDCGGLVGWNDEGTISNCYATGAVTGDDRHGGLVGSNTHGTISNCYANGAVTGGYNSDYLGGLVGYNDYGDIDNCYATGAVTGGDYSDNLGGLMGLNEEGTISNCYATGAVSGGYNSDYLGGLVGHIWGGTISDCYWDEESSGLSYSHGGRKKTTLEMKEEQTYVGWNDGTWVIDEGNDKPHLSWEEGASGLPAITTDYPVRSYPGNGQDQPFELDSSEDLICMSQRTIDWGANFVLTGDIDMNTVADYYPPSDFNGHIEGGGYSVRNLTVDAHVIGNNCQLGLIGRLSDGGHLENLGVEEPNIIGVDYSYYLGGLVGGNYGGTISNCYSNGSVNGGDHSHFLGGLVALNEEGTIRNCYATGSVTGEVYSILLGGLVGSNFFGAISNCYATGAVIGSDDSINLGGLVGGNPDGTISNCFWDTETSGMTSSGGGTGKTTAEMWKINTFTSDGWDFVGEGNSDPNDYWRMCVDDLEYPKLWWQFLDGDLVCPDGVGLLDLFYFVSHWLDIDCEAANNYCRRVDLNFSGRVDLVDYSIFTANWLKK